ncbi:MAG: hypothetical protein V3S44_00695 [Alphaproteobacteria bacterium]
MSSPLEALADFPGRLRTASWFSMIGEPLTAAERADTADYLKPLGFPDVALAEVASWRAAENCIKATDWEADWWDAEDRWRATLLARAEERFGKLTMLEALTAISEQVSDMVHGAAALAATGGGVADQGLTRAAAGAATMACHQAAVEAAADIANGKPFAAKFRLFAAGHWPLCVRGATFYVF